MTLWLELLIAVLCGLTVIAALGVPLAWALRLRGFAALVLIVPAAFAVLAVTSVVAPKLGVAWSLLPPLTAAILLAALLSVLPRTRARAMFVTAAITRPRRRVQRAAVPLALGIAGGTFAVLLLWAFRSPDAVSQTFDANFHLNAVRYILTTGNASPLGMELTSPGVPVFYPTLWHAFVALIVQLSGVSIPIATNAALLIAGSIVWPIGVLFLARVTVGPSTRITLFAGVFAVATPIFPLFLSSYGMLYPNYLALSLVPYAYAALLAGLQLTRNRHLRLYAPGTLWLLACASLGAAVFAHPSAVHAVVLCMAVPVFWVAWRRSRSGELKGMLWLLIIPVYCLFVLVLWRVTQTTENDWKGFFGPKSALFKIAFSAPHVSTIAPVLAVSIMLGVFALLRLRRQWWLLGSAFVLAGMYFIADGFHSSEWRTLLVGPWYNDPRRLAGLAALGMIPLALWGADSAWLWLRRTFSAPRRFRSLSFAVLLMLTLGATQLSLMPLLDTVRNSYDVDQPALLSADEEALLNRLDTHVPADALILNNPLNGSALSYAFAKRMPLFPHSGGLYSADAYALAKTIVSAPKQACALAQKLHVGYVLDFGTKYPLESTTSRAKPFAGMKHLHKSPILTEIDREGKAVLYAITGCDMK